MATIRQRPGPGGRRVWQARIARTGYPPQYRTFDVKAAATRWARRIESEMDRGVFADHSLAETTTLAEALRRYWSEVTPRKKGWLSEYHNARQLARDSMAQLHLDKVDGHHIADYRDRRIAMGRAPNTVRKELALLSHLFSVAQSEWGMPYLTNPVQLVTKPKVPRGRDRRLQSGEEERLLAAIRQWTRGPWLLPIVILAIETAMRKGELLALRWADVDLKRRTAHLRDTKNGYSRTVPLSPRAIRTLRALPRTGSEMVLPTTANAITLAWGHARERAGMPDLRFHDLRHEAVSRLFEMGLHPMEVASISGHRTMQMLARYTHLQAEDLAQKLADGRCR